jgi:hypothetical protein
VFTDFGIFSGLFVFPFLYNGSSSFVRQMLFLDELDGVFAGGYFSSLKDSFAQLIGPPIGVFQIFKGWFRGVFVVVFGVVVA